MTQESFLWVIGLILAVVSGLLGLGSELGKPLFSPEIETWLRIVAVLLGVVSAYLKGSPLPRKTWTSTERAARLANNTH